MEELRFCATVRKFIDTSVCVYMYEREREREREGEREREKGDR